MKKYTAKNAATVCKRILRNANRKNSGCVLRQAWIENGCTCVSDGRYAVVLNETPAGIVPEECNFHIMPLFDELCSNKHNYHLINAPDMDAVKTFCKTFKPGSAPFKSASDNDAPFLNPFYVKDILQIFPDAQWYADGLKKPIYAVCDQGKALIMPINYNPETDPAADHSDNAPAETPADHSNNTPAETPADHSDNAPAETPADHSDNTPAETPDQNAGRTRGTVPEKTFIGETIQGAGWRIYFDGSENRTRVIFDKIPPVRVREIVKEAGFYYSPKMKSWNKKLTFKAYRAAKTLSDRLSNIYAA